MRAPTMCSGRMHVKTAACDASPCSGVGGAAFEETPVAVTAGRFYWPARSREGAGSMGRDSPVERSSLGNASPWDARRGAQGSPGAAAPGAFWELFCGEKFPAGGKQARRDCVLLSNRPASGEFGPMWPARERCLRQKKRPQAVGQPLALADRYAGRKGLAATRTIGPYEGSNHRLTTAKASPKVHRAFGEAQQYHQPRRCRRSCRRGG